MGIISRASRKYPALKGKEPKVRFIMDLIFYALFLFMIWSARPVYIDYCSANPSLNVSSIKENQAYWANHSIEDLFQNSSDTAKEMNASLFIGQINGSWMYMNP